VPAVVPSPNDLATNPATGLLAVPIPASATGADKEFYAYLNTLNGIPTTAGAATTFDGELNASTVTASTVKVFDVTGGLTEVVSSSITYAKTSDAAAPGRISIQPPAGGWKPGNTYAVAIIGGTTGISQPPKALRAVTRRRDII
jgi:hypothetical protein